MAPTGAISIPDLQDPVMGGVSNQVAGQHWVSFLGLLPQKRHPIRGSAACAADYDHFQPRPERSCDSPFSVLLQMAIYCYSSASADRYPAEDEARLRHVGVQLIQDKLDRLIDAD